MPSWRIRASSRTSHSSPNSAAIFSACSARTSGVRRLAGSFFNSRLKFCASAMMRPRLDRSDRPAAPCATAQSERFEPLLASFSDRSSVDRARNRPGSLPPPQPAQTQAVPARSEMRRSDLPLRVRTAVADRLSHFGSRRTCRVCPAPASASVCLQSGGTMENRQLAGFPGEFARCVEF